MDEQKSLPALIDSMSLIEIQRQCRADSQAWFPAKENDLGFLLIALVGEVGEFANILKKIMRGDVNMGDTTTHDLAFEAADILIYLAIIADTLSIDLAKTYQWKREMNIARFGNPEEE